MERGTGTVLLALLQPPPDYCGADPLQRLTHRHPTCAAHHHAGRPDDGAEPGSDDCPSHRRSGIQQPRAHPHRLRRESSRTPGHTTRAAHPKESPRLLLYSTNRARSREAGISRAAAAPPREVWQGWIAYKLLAKVMPTIARIG